ncbi:MAG: iron ABC transporter permease [Epulopiscium sp.]|nr:iron ABC transporter permease [Candidatus Epulonipiscium sp.]
MKCIRKINTNFDIKIVALIVTIVTVALLVMYPILVLIGYSFGISFNGIEISLDAYKNLFFNKEVYFAVKNTLYIGFCITLFAGLLGGGLAFLVTKTDILCKKLIEKLIFGTFVIPSYIMAIAWIEIAGHNGFFTRFLYQFFNTKNPFEIYSLEGIIFVMVLHLYPMVFINISNALKNMDSNLEKAGFISGASSKKVISTIIIPIIMPSIFSILLFVFSKSIACFGVATVLGLPARKYVVTTYIFSSLSSLDIGSAVSLSVLLLIISGILFMLNNKYLKSKEYTSTNIVNDERYIYSLGKFKIVITIIILFFLFLTSFVPIIMIVISSFLKKWGIPLTFKNMTLNNYYNILFEERIARSAIKNSIIYGLISATIACVIGMVISYISNRTKTRCKKIVEFLSSLPMAIPETVLAIAAIFAWKNEPLKLYGTPWIIIVTYIGICLPMIVKNVNGLMIGFDPILEKASEINGASCIQTFKRIVIPMILPGIKAGFMMSMIFVLREIPVSIMLYSRGYETIGVLIYNLRSDTGGLEVVSAIAVIIIILITIGQLVIQKQRR